jgi:hypothetical protein
MTPEEQGHLISKYLDNSLDEREEAAFSRLLAADPGMGRRFCELAIQHVRLGRVLREKSGAGEGHRAASLSSTTLCAICPPEATGDPSPWFRMCLWASVVVGTFALAFGAILHWTGFRTAGGKPKPQVAPHVPGGRPGESVDKAADGQDAGERGGMVPLPRGQDGDRGAIGKVRPRGGHARLQQRRRGAIRSKESAFAPTRN